jgi:hypothetical protein
MASIATEQAASIRHREASKLVRRSAVIRVPLRSGHFPFSIFHLSFFICHVRWTSASRLGGEK